MKKSLVLLTLLFSVCLFCQAQEKSELEQKVDQLLDVSGSKTLFQQSIQQIIEMQKTQFDGLFDGSEDGNKFLEEFSKEVLETGYDDLMKELVPVYAKHLTIEELDGIIAFYQTTAGKALVEKLPVIMGESMQIGAAWGEKLADDILKKMEKLEDEE